MSGPLATWAAEHSKASWRGRAVLLQYALAANHDGRAAADVTRDDLERRTGLGRMTVIAGRQELLELGELLELQRPGGRGRPGRYRVAIALCEPDAGCWSCTILAGVSTERVRDTDGLASPKHRKRPPRSRKGPSQSRKGPRGGPTTETGTAPLGGAVPPRESAAAELADGSPAAAPGQPATVPDWRALIGKTIPDDGERFTSREAEEETKRQRAAVALLRQDGAA